MRYRRLAISAESVFQLAEILRLALQAVKISGEHNDLANILLRRWTVLDTEWHLGLSAFQWVSSMSPTGPPTVDLFAKNIQYSVSQVHLAVSGCSSGAGRRSSLLLATGDVL